MEIKRFMDLYKENSPEEFFNWLAKGKVLEIRFLSDARGNKFNNWNLIKVLAQDLHLEARFNSLFITNYKQLKSILLYRINSWPLTRLYNIFISVNPKRKVFVLNSKGIPYKSYYGGIAGTSHIQTILCDIEHIGEREGNATEEMLEECIQGAKYLVKLLNLTDYYINISGNGVHLWIALEEAIELPLPSSREVIIKGRKVLKYNLKEEPINGWIKTYNRYIELLNKKIKAYNPELKVDEGAKDISRVARPVGSWNVKKNKVQRAVGTVVKNNQINKGINLKFLAVKPLLNKETKEFQEIKVKSKNHRYNALNICECPLYKLMVSKLLPSTLSRNHFLEQSFARILRDNDLSPFDFPDLISKIDEVQEKAIQVDPDYIEDDEPFNPETVNAYCYTCKVDFVYPILEDVPVVGEGFLTDEHYNNLNSYSDRTVFAMAEDTTLKVPGSYFELKILVRNLIDKYDRSQVFFTIKNLLKDDWEFLDRNKIILQLLNKTRRVKDEG